MFYIYSTEGRGLQECIGGLHVFYYMCSTITIGLTFVVEDAGVKLLQHHS